MSFLFSFVASFVVFDVLGFSMNWFFTLVVFNKKGNAVPMQTGVRLSGQAKTNYIIPKHMYTRRFTFLIVCDRLFLILVVLILDHMWPVWSGCKMTCFCYITGTTINCSVHEHDLKNTVKKPPGLKY